MAKVTSKLQVTVPKALASERQRRRNRSFRKRPAGPGRGWTREELYDRGRAR